MIKSVLTCCRVVACLLLPAFFNSALALDTLPHDTLTYTHELKPIPYEAFNLARVTFLPEVKDSEFGFSGNELDGDYNSNSGDCSNKDSLYTSANCLYPYGVVSSSQCAFLPGYYTQCKCLTKFNKTSCDAPYVLGGDNCDGKYEKCVCPAKVELTCPNDTCTKTCDGNCIAKSCTPTANQTGCTNGTKACDDGCCGTNRKCCVPCTDKITSKPANSYYTYSSCTDGNGSKQIKTGWKCNSGYHEKNGACEKDCIVNSCSAYTLSSCPTYGNCSKCTKTAKDCSTDGTRYKLDSCDSGYKKSGNECIQNNMYRPCMYPGDYLYDDMSCLSYVNYTAGDSPDKRVIGVIVSTDPRVAINLGDASQKYKPEGIEYCNNFSSSSVYGWHLPSYSEFRLIYAEKEPLEASLYDYYNTTQEYYETIFSPDEYWTSEPDYEYYYDDGINFDYYYYFGITYSLSKGTSYEVNDDDYHAIRCVLPYKDPAPDTVPCIGYTLDACPENANCSSCYLSNYQKTIYKIDSCQDGYFKSGSSKCNAAKSCSDYGYIPYESYIGDFPYNSICSDAIDVLLGTQKAKCMKCAYCSSFGDQYKISKSSKCSSDDFLTSVCKRYSKKSISASSFSNYYTRGTCTEYTFENIVWWNSSAQTCTAEFQQDYNGYNKYSNDYVHCIY